MIKKKLRRPLKTRDVEKGGAHDEVERKQRLHDCLQLFPPSPAVYGVQVYIHHLEGKKKMKKEVWCEVDDGKKEMLEIDEKDKQKKKMLRFDGDDEQVPADGQTKKKKKVERRSMDVEKRPLNELK